MPIVQVGKDSVWMSKRYRKKFPGSVVVLVSLLVLLVAACGDKVAQTADKLEPADELSIPVANKEVSKKVSHEMSQPQEQVTSPEDCAGCHAEQVRQWSLSHHALANRAVSLSKDANAFATPLPDATAKHIELSLNDSEFGLKDIGNDTQHAVVGVIGYTPIHQYLVELPGKRWQALSTAYDVEQNRWVDIFAGDERQAGDWGHWTGQGMNWNANCGWCHTTGFKKQYDLDSDSYASSWQQQGISCAACHGKLASHVTSAQEAGHGLVLPESLSQEQQLDVCAACHSRRDSLTADGFSPGEAFANHFSLSLPDQPGLYFPDGQIRDEVFVYGSFAMSKMHQAGVDCLDCHKPHSLDTVLPVDDNSLCMSCHASGANDAPLIEPTAHSHHEAGSSGNRCVACHMPETLYMQVDARADHGFLLPDPLMTEQLGIPNACSGCHDDKPLAWSVEWAEKRHGAALANSRQRQRAKALDAAYNGQAEAAGSLLALLKDEAIPAWRASYIGLLASNPALPGVPAAIQTAASDSSPLVRLRAAFALAGTAEGRRLLKDDWRAVRLAAAQSQPFADADANRELMDYLNYHADRPQSLLMLATLTDPRGKSAQIERYVDKAIALDSHNAQLHQQGAVVLSRAGLNQQAVTVLNNASGLFPDQAMFPYSLALVSAEGGDYSKAISYLERAVALQPDFSRAWYNLSLAYRHTGQGVKAEQAMARARATSAPAASP